MGVAAWAVPVAVLAALAFACFAFIWWWFPRHYRAGVQADMDRVDQERRGREAYMAEIQAKRERGEEVDEEGKLIATLLMGMYDEI
jgi:hypothetical protein